MTVFGLARGVGVGIAVGVGVGVGVAVCVCVGVCVCLAVCVGGSRNYNKCFVTAVFVRQIASGLNFEKE